MLWSQATSDEAGRFEIGGLGEGTANLFIHDQLSDGPWTYRAVQDATLRPGESTDVEIELIEGVMVEGRVVSSADGGPVEGALVALYGPMRPRSGAAVINMKTGQDGCYRFHVPPGETYFYVQGPTTNYVTLPQQSASSVRVPD